MAREAERLFLSLQARRLRGERRTAQRQLATALDGQREYKRMLSLAEYQEELVNIYGPSMKNIIADTFFDDGSDPVSALLQENTEQDQCVYPAAVAGPAQQQLAWRKATAMHARRDQGLSLSRQEMNANASAATAQYMGYYPPTARHSDDSPAVHSVARQREVLHRALDEVRDGRRRPF